MTEQLGIGKLVFGSRASYSDTMKTLIQNSLASVLRFALAAFGSWVAVQSGHDLAVGDPSDTTVLQLVTGLVLVGITVGLKKLDGTQYGAIGTALIGPRVVSMSASIARLLVAAFSSGLASLVDVGAFDTLEPGLGDEPVVVLVVLLMGLAYDRVSKALSP